MTKKSANNSISSKQSFETTSSFPKQSFETASGKIDFPFTNDYMFRVILQSNKRILKALICSLLHMSSDEIQSVEIKNPIELGKRIENKDFILDIAVLLNNHHSIDLEMQVQNQLNWEERSLCYLCRTFDQLNHGQDYSEAKPAIHIGFLDFTPFPEYPEFYATYRMKNLKNQHIYSDKFTLSVLSLSQIDKATTEDKHYHIDDWARLLKATTWEELKMIAKKDDALREASENLYTMNADDTVRWQCWARQDYYRLQNAINHKMEQLTTENENLKKLLAEHGISY